MSPRSLSVSQPIAFKASAYFWPHGLPGNGA